MKTWNHLALLRRYSASACARKAAVVLVCRQAAEAPTRRHSGSAAETSPESIRSCRENSSATCFRCGKKPQRQCCRERWSADRERQVRVMAETSVASSSGSLRCTRRATTGPSDVLCQEQSATLHLDADQFPRTGGGAMLLERDGPSKLQSHFDKDGALPCLGFLRIKRQ